MATCLPKPLSSQATHLTFVPTKNAAHPQKYRRVLAAIDSEDKKPGFCCPVHKEMFEDELDNDEEVEVARPAKRGAGVALIDDFSCPTTHRLIAAQEKRETGSQCVLDDPQPNRMAELATRSISPLDGQTVTILQTQRPALTLPKPQYSPIKPRAVPAKPQYAEAPQVTHYAECHICNARFTSGQALGGHTSRKHAKLRDSRS